MDYRYWPFYEWKKHLLSIEKDDIHPMRPNYLSNFGYRNQTYHIQVCVYLPSVVVAKEGHSYFYPSKATTPYVLPKVESVHSKRLHQHKKKQHACCKELRA